MTKKKKTLNQKKKKCLNSVGGKRLKNEQLNSGEEVKCDFIIPGLNFK